MASKERERSRSRERSETGSDVSPVEPQPVADGAAAKLDFSRFEEPLRSYAIALRDALIRGQDAFEQHVSRAKRPPSGIGDAEYFGDPAVYGLLRHGERGLDALYSLATEDGWQAAWTARRVLLMASFGQAQRVIDHLELTVRYLDDSDYERLLTDVRTTFACEGFAKRARGLVQRIVRRAFGLGKHDEVVWLLTTARVGIDDDEKAATAWIIDLISEATLRVNLEACEKFEALVGKGDPERVYQEFLEQHPAMIDPMASEVVPRQALAEVWKSDFVIRRLDGEYTFVEIEKPQDVLFTAYPQPAEPLSHAMGQLLNWFIWVEDNIAYARTHGFPGITAPRGVIVIGRDAALNAEQRRQLQMLNACLGPRVTILTYDDVLRLARNLVRNLVSDSSVV